MDTLTAVEELKKMKEQRLKASNKYYKTHISSKRERTPDELIKQKELIIDRRERSNEYYKNNKEAVLIKRKARRLKLLEINKKLK